MPNSSEKWRRPRLPQAALLLSALVCCFGSACVWAGSDTAVMVGGGATVWPWHWTDGAVIPLLLEFDDSRFELGAFRFATQQYLKSPGWPPSTVSAHRYWASSAMRRWQILHRSWFKLYLGTGAVYRSETDLLDASKWDFAWLVAMRYSPGGHVFVELDLRHWSDAWIRLPNRGQNMVLVTLGIH